MNFSLKAVHLRVYAQRPVRAFAALTNATKRIILHHGPGKPFKTDNRKSDKPIFTALIAERISRLPASALVKIIHPVSDWLSVSSKVLLEKHPIQFENVWKKRLPY